VVEAIRCGRPSGGNGRQHDSVMGTQRESEGLMQVGDSNGGGWCDQLKRRV
jgi:hypothetical protein